MRENNLVTEEIQKKSGFSRRTVIKGAAWSVPVIAAAVATPLAAASGDIGAFSVDGDCGVLGLGLLATGIDVTASPTAPIPAGTTITLTGTGLANIGVISVTGGTADVAVLSPTTRVVTLTAPLPAGSTLSLDTTINVSVLWTLTAVAALPAGFTATGAKTSGSTSGTLVLCTEA
jgi:hypothetical protein